jgi:hypothetical protein
LHQLQINRADSFHSNFLQKHALSSNNQNSANKLRTEASIGYRLVGGSSIFEPESNNAVIIGDSIACWIGLQDFGKCMGDS